MNNEPRGLVARQADQVHWFSDARAEAEGHGVRLGRVGLSVAVLTSPW
jgi:hypothetical protein